MKIKALAIVALLASATLTTGCTTTLRQQLVSQAKQPVPADYQACHVGVEPHYLGGLSNTVGGAVTTDVQASGCEPKSHRPGAAPHQ